MTNRSRLPGARETAATRCVSWLNTCCPRIGNQSSFPVVGKPIAILLLDCFARRFVPFSSPAVQGAATMAGFPASQPHTQPPGSPAAAGLASGRLLPPSAPALQTRSLPRCRSQPPLGPQHGWPQGTFGDFVGRLHALDPCEGPQRGPPFVEVAAERRGLVVRVLVAAPQQPPRKVLPSPAALTICSICSGDPGSWGRSLTCGTLNPTHSSLATQAFDDLVIVLLCSHRHGHDCGL